MATVKISTENNQIVFTDSTGATYPYSQSSVDGRYNDTEVWLEATSDKADVIANARFSGELVRDIDA